MYLLHGTYQVENKRYKIGKVTSSSLEPVDDCATCTAARKRH